jgi:hypothetical protein
MPFMALVGGALAALCAMSPVAAMSAMNHVRAAAEAHHEVKQSGKIRGPSY